MKKSILTLACLAVVAAATTMCTSEKKSDNPFIAGYDTKYEIPPFEQIQLEHYIPAMEAGIAEQNANIDAIINNEEAPTFENTIVAMEYSAPILDRVNYVFEGLTESNNSPELDSISNIYRPAVTAHSDAIMMNDALFQRVKAVYDNRENLATDQRMLVEKYYKNFTRAGALLSPEDKEKLKELNIQLEDLYMKFNKNLLAATNAFEIVVTDTARLAGLPNSTVAEAASQAQKRGKEGYVFTLHAPSRLPVLQYADDRDLREQMWRGYTTLASEGEYDNRPVINQILQARAKKAALLGYDNFGSYQTANVMSGSIENAENLLMQIWGPAKARVADEVAEMQKVVNAEGGNFKIAPWDYYYYAEKVRAQKYDLSEAEVRQYLALDSVRAGLYTMAEKLYGIKFTPMPDAPKYFDEVSVFDVTDANTGEHIAVYMSDYYPRESKRQGAWMSKFKGIEEKEDGTFTRPIVYNVCNFTKPTADAPALLSLKEVETMFHEFGHGLHGMLTQAKYPSIASTRVDRDFVELPSQIHEHWAFEPEMLKAYAHHYQTGEPMPDELIAKMQASSKHNQGFTTSELCAAALLDLQYGKLNPEEDIDIFAFEEEVGKQLGLPAELTYRYRSPYFKHIFGSDHYASGYYTYLWAEVLDADGYELFTEKGIFDPETAKSFKENVLEAGGSDEPMKLFVKFRGHEPSVDALLRQRGLWKPESKDLKVRN